MTSEYDYCVKPESDQLIDARVKSALLWGVVAGLCFPVLVMGYRIALGPLPVGIAETTTIALLLAGLVAGVTYLTEHRMARKGRT